MRQRITGWIMERAVAVCGLGVALMIGVMFFFLIAESRFAFDREVGFGMRFAAQPLEGELAKEEVAIDPNGTLITAHADGMTDLDDKESIAMPTLDELRGIATSATGTIVPAKGQSIEAAEKEKDALRLTRDLWDPMVEPTSEVRARMYAFTTPEHQGKTFRLRWEPDAAFDPDHAAHKLKLRFIQAPPGVDKSDIDLSSKPVGSIDLPAWSAATDAERTHRYVFEVVAEPKYSSAFSATVAGLFRTDWAPTLQYPRFGFIPLILSTLTITILALLIASLPALMTAIYLSEMAPNRIREWLKPVIELLASVPTVVLAYFGLMLVAPGLVASLGKALNFESGRSLLTAAVIMAVLIIPTIVSIAEDALRTVPASLRNGAEALGLTSTEAIRLVVVRAAKPGLISALLFGFARAVGETMIVWILGGGTVMMPKLSPQTLGQPTRGVADTIGIEMANVVFEQPHYGHLFLIGLVLFVITVAVNLLGHRLSARRLA